jgi:hypothetical protein
MNLKKMCLVLILGLAVVGMVVAQSMQSWTDGHGVFVQEAQNGSGHYYFVIENSNNHPVNVELTLGTSHAKHNVAVRANGKAIYQVGRNRVKLQGAKVTP